MPAEQSIEVLEPLRNQGKDFTFELYSGAGHGLLDVPPTDPAALPRFVDWIASHTD